MWIKTSENTLVDVQGQQSWLHVRRRGAAPTVGTLSRAVAGDARGQGLGLPSSLLGCPCRLRGRFKGFVSDRHLSKKIFQPSMTHSCESSRAWGWRGRRESRLPNELPPISLSDCRCIRIALF